MIFPFKGHKVGHIFWWISQQLRKNESGAPHCIGVSALIGGMGLQQTPVQIYFPNGMPQPFCGIWWIYVIYIYIYNVLPPGDVNVDLLKSHEYYIVILTRNHSYWTYVTYVHQLSYGKRGAHMVII